MDYPQGVATTEVNGDTFPAMSQKRKSGRSRSALPASEQQNIAIGTKSMNQVTSEKGYPQHRSSQHTNARDSDSASYSSCGDKNFSSSAPTPPGNFTHDISSRQQDTTIPTGSTMQPRPQAQVPSKQAPSHLDRWRRTTVTKQSPSFLQKVGVFFTSGTEVPSTSSDLEQELTEKVKEIACLRADLREKENSIGRISERVANDQRSQYETLLHDQKRELDLNKDNFELYKRNKKREEDEIVSRLQAEIHEIKSERDLIHTKHVTLVRQQQEEAFKQMESARWLPPEESKVLGNFERIKRDMKSWAKGTATKDISLIQKLGEKDIADLINVLSSVVLLQESQLPQGLSTSRAPGLLLNALLAHDVYTNIFCNPFSFLKDGIGESLSKTGQEETLHKIYLMAQDSDPQDAHVWRSETLRLLLPPLRNDGEGEKALRSWTEGLISKASDRFASDFLASPARFLIDSTTIANTTKKLKAIYQDAANISYMLWTRRTTIKCVTLREMGRPTFDLGNPNFEPHLLVHPEKHKNELRGMPITVIVHPLVKVYGTDEAKDYDEGRIWVPAEVWLNS